MLPPPALDVHGVRVVGVEAPASVEKIALQVPEISMNVSCIDCTSPVIPELSELLASDGATEEVTEVVNRMLGYITSLLAGEYFQVSIDRALHEASRKCPHSDQYEVNPSPIEYEPFESPEPEDSVALVVASSVVVLALIVAVWAILLATKYFVRRRQRKWLEQLSNHQVLKIWENQTLEADKEETMNATTKAMYQSDEIPWLVRTTVPFVILGNIGFFLSGHLSLGASVSVFVNLAGETYEAANFFEFSMLKSTVEIWEGKDQDCQ